MRIYRPPVAPRQLTLLLSGDGGWGSGLDGLAQRLALQQGTLVAGIDVRAWLRQLQDSSVSCASPGAYLADLARFLEVQYGLPSRPAVLVGHSAGATLAYVALAQARPHTFAGAVTLSFCADLDLTKRLCPSSALREMPRPSGIRLLPSGSLPARWVALHGVQDRTCPVSDSREFARAIPGVLYVPLPDIGHTYSASGDWWPQLARAFAELTAPPAGGPERPAAPGEELR